MEGQERRVMARAWNQVAECEERIDLMKALVRLGVGVAEVEEIGISIHSKFKSNNFKSRVKDGEVVSKEALRELMLLKLKDEKKHLKELLIIKNGLRRELEQKLKKNSRPSRNILKDFREKSARTRKELREKYRANIDHLKR